MLKNIPANIITGFLGVGKTTAILSLLNKKPVNEHWAVLVNEFGEVGIDGAILDTQTAGDIAIREVPGGCMCCAAGVPMNVALSQLIAKAKPDRVLIEPSGLGHPKEVLRVLAAYVQQDILDIRATITLVDARKVNDSRYTSHDIFNQQIEIADVVIANKSDLYTAGDHDSLGNYLAHKGDANLSLLPATQGEFELALLDGPNRLLNEYLHNEPVPGHVHSDPEMPQVFPESGYLLKENSGQGMSSLGWIFHARFVFDYIAIRSWVMGLECDRLKGIVITDQGIVALNLADGVLSEVSIDEAFDSRIELIFDASEIEITAREFQDQLLACVRPNI